MRVVSLSEQEVGDNSIHRTAHFSALQVDLRLPYLLLSRIDGGLCLQRISFIDLLLFSAAREIRQATPTFGLQILHVKVRHPLLQDRLVRAQCDVKIKGIDDIQKVAFVHELVVDNSQFRDLTGNLRRYTCNLNSDTPVACPGPSVIMV